MIFEKEEKEAIENVLKRNWWALDGGKHGTIYQKFLFPIFLLIEAGKWIRRNNFTCQYCGRKTPEVELQIDHKFPKSKGEKKLKDNLITICRECNLGKGDIILSG